MRASVFFGGTRAAPLVGSCVFPVLSSDESFVRAKADITLSYYYRLYYTTLCVRHTPLIVKTSTTARPTRFFFHSFNFVCYFIYFFSTSSSSVVMVRSVLLISHNDVKTSHARGAFACIERAAPRFGRCPKSVDDAFLFFIRYESKTHSTPARVADKLEFKYLKKNLMSVNYCGYYSNQ